MALEEEEEGKRERKRKEMHSLARACKSDKSSQLYLLSLLVFKKISNPPSVKKSSPCNFRPRFAAPHHRVMCTDRPCHGDALRSVPAAASASAPVASSQFVSPPPPPLLSVWLGRWSVSAKRAAAARCGNRQFRD